MSAGTAIVSFDCEGKWGVADNLTRGHCLGLSDERLRWAYGEVTSLLRRHELTATFAFVELFTRSQAELRECSVDELAQELPYLRAAAKGIASGDQGWSGAWALDLVGPSHEIAFHGFSHVPWSELGREQARREMQLTPPDHRRTMIFPRNKIAHLDVLEDFGCFGYRGARRFGSRATALISELNICETSQAAFSRIDKLTEIPAGVFINWRSGLRRLVPRAITRRRARNIISHAAETGGIAHFWMHPENIATHPETLDNLNCVVREIAEARDAGLIVVQTQLQHCLKKMKG